MPADAFETRAQSVAAPLVDGRLLRRKAAQIQHDLREVRLDGSVPLRRERDVYDVDPTLLFEFIRRDGQVVRIDVRDQVDSTTAVARRVGSR